MCSRNNFRGRNSRPMKKHTLVLIQTDNILFKLYQIEKLDLKQIIAVVMIVEYVRCMSLPVNEKMNIAY